MNFGRLFFILSLAVIPACSLSGWHTDNHEAAELEQQHVEQGKKLYNGKWECHSTGEWQFSSEGSATELKQAFFYFDKVAQGHDNPIAQAESYLFLGLMYYRGQGISQSTEHAIEYLKKAVRKSSAISLSIQGNYHIEILARTYLAEIAWKNKDYRQSLLDLAFVENLCWDLDTYDQNNGKRDTINYHYIEYARAKVLNYLQTMRLALWRLYMSEFRDKKGVDPRNHLLC